MDADPRKKTIVGARTEAAGVDRLDRGAASSPPAAPTRGLSPLQDQRWTLAASILASSLAFIDGSIINVTLPALNASLGGTAADLQWTINAYLLPLSALLLLGGAAGDNYGRRSLLIAGISIFALASIGCGLAPTFEFLFVMRALQGVGAALLMPNSLALLGSTFSGAGLSRAIGTWAAAAVVSSALGPPLGGYLVEIAGWRSIFLLNVPIAIVTALILLRHVTPKPESRQRLDWWGALLATLALGLFTWSLTLWSSRQAMSAIGWAMAFAALVPLLTFIWNERALGDRAMMPLSMFASAPFVGLTLVTLLIYGALGGLFILLPYVLIDGGYTPLQAGLALLPFSVINAVASRIMGRLSGQYGARWPLCIGSCTCALGYALLARVDPSGSYWLTVVPGAAVISFGMGAAVAPLTSAVLASVDDRHTGTASGFNSAIGRIGALIVTALIGMVLAQTGAALVSSFHGVAWIGGAMAFVSAIVAWATLKPGLKTAALTA